MNDSRVPGVLGEPASWCGLKNIRKNGQPLPEIGQAPLGYPRPRDRLATRTHQLLGEQVLVELHAYEHLAERAWPMILPSEFMPG
jgi:hypothetical protein